MESTHGSRPRRRRGTAIATRGNVRRLFLALGTVALSTGCHTWRPVELTATPHPEQVRVWTQEHGAWTLLGAQVVGDSLLVGVDADGAVQQRSVHVDFVVATEERVTSVSGTMGVVALSVVGAMTLLTLAAIAKACTRDILNC